MYYKSICGILVFMMLFANSLLHAQWNQSQGIDEAYFYDMVIVDSSVFAATTNGVFARQLSGGEWVQKLANAYVTNIIKAGPALFASNISNIYRTLDQGITWVRMDTIWGTNDWFPFVTNCDTVVFFACTSGTVYRSDDFGDSLFPVLLSGSWPFNLNYTEGSLFFVGYLVNCSKGIIYESTDLGVTWDTIPMAGMNSQWNWNCTAIVKHHGQLWASDGTKLFAFDANQQAWTLIQDSLYFYWMRVVDDCLYGSSCFNGFYRYDSVSSAWIAENTGLETMHVCAVAGFDTTLFLATIVGPYTCSNPYIWEPDYYGLNQAYISMISSNGNQMWVRATRGIFISTDQGAHFTHHTFQGIPIPDQAILTDSVYYVIAADSIYISHDQGITWLRENTGLPWSAQWPNLYLSALAINNDYLFLGTNKGLFRSLHNPVTWEKVEAMGGRRIRSLHVYDSVLFASGIIYANNTVFFTFRSADNGASFDSIECFPVGYEHFIANDENNFYALIFNQLFRSTDDGISWAQMPMETTQLNGDRVLANEGAVIVTGEIPGWTGVGTYFSVTYDDGNHWYDLRGNLPNPAWPIMGEDNINDQRLFASSGYNGGLWYRDDILTGIEHDKTISHSGIVLSPNPAHDQVLVSYQAAGVSAGFISVYSIAGIRVLNQTPMEPTSKGLTITLDIEGFPTGIYLVCVHTVKGTVWAKLSVFE